MERLIPQLGKGKQVNGFGTPTQAPASRLRSLYRDAARAFLLRDYPAVATSLNAASSYLLDLPAPSQDSWLTLLEPQGPSGSDDRTLEVRRKLAILKMTFSATAMASPSSGSNDALLTTQYPLLAKNSHDLLYALWNDLLPSSTAGSNSEPLEILPTPEAAFLHPSLPTALALAALKLDEPKIARQVAESWFGSVDPRVEGIVAEVVTAASASGASDLLAFAFSDNSSAMEASTASVGGGAEKEGTTALAASWIKLHDLLVLHVLPRLKEWEAAGDFARSQAVENGGFLPDERVEATIKQLGDLREQTVQAEAAAAERERAIAADLSRSSRRNGSSNSKASCSKPRNDPSNSPPKTVRPQSSPTSSSSSARPASSAPAEPPTGFAALRTSLSSLLEHGQETPVSSASTTPAQSAQSTSSFVTRYLNALKAQDPARLLAAICVVFAAVSWIRRWRRRAGVGRAITSGVSRKTVREYFGDAVSKVVDTVRMGTKVTTL